MLRLKMVTWLSYIGRAFDLYCTKSPPSSQDCTRMLNKHVFLGSGYDLQLRLHAGMLSSTLTFYHSILPSTGHAWIFQTSRTCLFGMSLL